MSTTAYVEVSLLWAGIGFICGFTVGYVYQLVRTRHLPRISNVTFGGFVLLLAVIMVVQNYLYQRDRSALVECQARYNLAMSAALQDRTEAAAHDRNAITTFLRTLYSNPGNDRVELQAFRTFLRRADQADRRLANNPLPPVPSGRCGLE